MVTNVARRIFSSQQHACSGCETLMAVGLGLVFMSVVYNVKPKHIGAAPVPAPERIRFDNDGTPATWPLKAHACANGPELDYAIAAARLSSAGAKIRHSCVRGRSVFLHTYAVMNSLCAH